MALCGVCTDLDVVDVACQRQPGHTVHEIALPQSGTWPGLPCKVPQTVPLIP